MVIGFLIFYGFIFVISLVGNIWVLVTCYRNLYRNRFSPMWYVANLASADLLFTFLTPFHAINFSWRWVGGDVICKLHAFLFDTSYNTSITTLVVIAYLRLKAITDPFNSRSQNFSNKEYIKLVLIWCMCLVISSPTASMNKVETNEDGKLICTNTSWGSTGREIYYTVHAILFFIIPLIYMIATQRKIFRSLRANAIPIWRWVGGNVICKLHAFLFDTSYNTSITTLVVIAYLRLKAITDPFNSRSQNFSNKEYIKIVLIWCMCLVISSPTASMNKVETDEDGKLICTNTSWGSTGREIYYIVHAILFYIIPLFYMIVTQRKIFRSLRAIAIPMCNSHIINTNQRHKKVAKTLAALSLAFFSCQSPFMIFRLLMYSNLVSPSLVWSVTQMMICLNVALDPLLYGYYGENLKSKVRRFLRCN
ncbi:hypothetical protein pdam_00006765 [Pocillopora damicornis]|uniref:G-protein coupled receptors family 1 profile domain-containing protein n=1 Tax=Pocillopora damicornis TaxID=46731 RepID=A0A3M6UVR4_POCDA|nr:hypothetical protein pdam_00006765 [Pocillopora damicornis]